MADDASPSPGGAAAPFLTRRTALAGGAGLALAACAGRGSAAGYDVIVAGAGLSGLFAADALVGAGMRVLVVEAGSRVGGRLWTLDDLPGRPEAGGAQVGQTYARVRYAAARTRVAVNAPQSTEAGRNRLLAIGEARLDEAVWAQANVNPFPERFRSRSPDSVLFAAAAPKNPFAAPDDWMRAGDDADLSVEAFLASEGFDAAARRLVNVAFNGADIADVSMVNVWRTLHLYAEDRALGPSGAIAGGAQRLPEAMAAALEASGASVRRETKLVSVESARDRVRVVVETAGRRQTLRADFCILALPFPALLRIGIDPAPPAPQAEAIRRLPYTQIVQLHLAAEAPFWETDGAPPAMWTDGPLERIFATTDETGAVVGFNAWINGEPARALARLSDGELEAMAQTEFARLRPASAGRVRLLKSIRWTDAGAPLAGGAYMHWAPGGVRAYAGAMGAPVGRIHFAGEHLSRLHTGMEGAVESGHAAALAILDAAGA